MKRPCMVSLGDLVRSKSDSEFYGFVVYIDRISGENSYYVEVVYDEDADSLYFYDDELEVMKLVKE